MKKKILIIIGIIALIIIGLISYFVISDLNQENKLKKELIEISDLVNNENIDIDKINNKLNTIITKDDYAIVEKAYKNYLKDSFNNSLQMFNLLNDERITTSLTIENYKEDGKEFKNTKSYLSNTIKSLEECKNKYYELLTEEKAMSYLNNDSLDNYYIEFYKNKMISDIESEKQDKTIEDSINDVISILKSSEKVIDFLINNKNNWEIDNNEIVFKNDKLINKYNELINNL